MADEENMADSAATTRKRILLVDDDREIVESMRIALEAAGYDILVARDGNQGLALADREDPDLVILDMMMPKRSGFLVLEKIRRSGTPLAKIKIIMITANEGDRHMKYARDKLGRRRLHPQALRHGSSAGQRRTPAGVSAFAPSGNPGWLRPSDEAGRSAKCKESSKGAKATGTPLPLADLPRMLWNSRDSAIVDSRSLGCG
jgi:CheY-like chemotaxis protein